MWSAYYTSRTEYEIPMITHYAYLETKRGYKVFDSTDIQCEVVGLTYAQLSDSKPGEASAVIREGVVAARQIQSERYKGTKIHCNAQMTDRMIHEYCQLDKSTSILLRTAMEKLQLSARAYGRIIKVARTIADLEASSSIQSHHIAEAIGYRNLDRSDWAER